MAGWFSKRRAFDKARLAQLFDDYELPSFPAAVLEVLRILRDDDSANADIAHALELDPGMSVRLIRVVNSAVYGLRQPADDLEQAIQLIGRESVESMLIAAAVGSTLPLERKHGFDPRRFWRTAGLRAAVAGALAARLCRSERSLCWTAALLQDLAVPLLIDSIGERYGDVLAESRTGENSLQALERAAFGWNHAEIGAALAASWDLPDPLTAAIGGHHPDESDDDEDAAPIPVLLVANLEPGDGDPDPDALLASAQDRFDVDPDAVRDAITTGLDEADQFTSLVSS
jgi:HD-like signal output (HDOD) protein